SDCAGCPQKDSCKKHGADNINSLADRLNAACMDPNVSDIEARKLVFAYAEQLEEELRAGKSTPPSEPAHDLLTINAQAACCPEPSTTGDLAPKVLRRQKASIAAVPSLARRHPHGSSRHAQEETSSPAHCASSPQPARTRPQPRHVVTIE